MICTRIGYPNMVTLCLSALDIRFVDPYVWDIYNTINTKFDKNTPKHQTGEEDLWQF
jgi:hypothetical protein